MNTENLLTRHVESACNNPQNLLTKSFFNDHILVVLDYSKRLCKKFNSNSEIVSFAALLHDISVVYDFKTMPTHNIDSSLFAEVLLNELEYPEDKIEQVKSCIVKHSFPLKIYEGTLDEVILSNADAMSQIVKPTYWLNFANKIKGLSSEDATTWYINRVKSNWINLIDPAKNMIEKEYLSTLDLLNHVDFN